MRAFVIVVLLVVIVAVIAVVPLVIEAMAEPRKVAVLVCAEYAESLLRNDADFWYDTVLTYCTLKQNGFADEDIYVLYGHGTDGFYHPGGGAGPTGLPASLDSTSEERYYLPPYCVNAVGGRAVVQITDFPMTYPQPTGTSEMVTPTGMSRPQELLQCLATGCKETTSEYGTIKRMRKKDFLFVWWKGHGDERVDSQGSADFRLKLDLSEVSAADVLGWLAKIQAGRRMLVFEACSSGCLTATVDTVTPPTVLFASAGCDDDADNNFRPNGGLPHSVWTYWVDCLLQGTTDVPGTGWPVSLEQGTAIATAAGPGMPLDEVFRISEAATQAYSGQNPAKKDECFLAPFTTIDVGDPTGHKKVPCPNPDVAPDQW